MRWPRFESGLNYMIESCITSPTLDLIGVLFDSGPTTLEHPVIDTGTED